MVQGRWSNARASDESASQTSPLTVASSETDPPCLRERAVNAGSRGDTTLTGAKREIEEFLMEQPEIAEAAVVAEADRVRGEIPVAYVVWNNGADAAVIDARCREKLASFKIPRRFESIDKLPRNALGKVQKHLLQKGQSA